MFRRIVGAVEKVKTQILMTQNKEACAQLHYIMTMPTIVPMLRSKINLLFFGVGFLNSPWKKSGFVLILNKYLFYEM